MLTSNKPSRKYNVEIVEMELHLRLLKLAPSYLSAYEISLGKDPFVGHYSVWDCEYQYVSTGEVRARRTVSGPLPPMFHVIMLSQKQYHGDYSTNIHYLQHFNVAELVLDAQDGSEPVKIEYDWEEVLPNSAYYFHCISEMNKSYTGYNAANSFLTFNGFKHGYVCDLCQIMIK